MLNVWSGWTCTLGSFKISQCRGIPPYMFLTRSKTYEKLVETRKKIDFWRFDTCPDRYTGPQKFGRKILPENFSKKKLFFLAMFKNEITTFKKNFIFSKKFFFYIFFQKIFRKMAIKFDWALFFS